MILNWQQLNSRGFIKISGKNSRDFLQKLISQDLNILNNVGDAIYSLLLNAKGRYKSDFFIILSNIDSVQNNQTAATFILDIATCNLPDTIQTLRKYNLNTDIEITDISKNCVCLASYNHNIVEIEQFPQLPQKILGNYYKFFKYLDPRLSQIGARALCISQNHLTKDTGKPFDEPTLDLENNCKNTTSYNYFLTKFGVPHENVLIANKSIPLEFNMHNLNSISFTKGCFLGQELCARTKYTGVIRKQILPFFLQSPSTKNSCNVDDLIINDSNQKIGTVKYFRNDCGLAMINLESFKQNKNFFVYDMAIKIIQPSWLN